MREGAHFWAFLAVSSRESAATIHGILAFALLWLDWVRAHSHTHGVEGVRLFVPEGTSRPLRAQASALSTAARTEVYEFDSVDGRVEKMDAAEFGNLESRLTMRREVESALTAAQESAARIPALAPMLGDVACLDARECAAGREGSGVFFSWAGICAVVARRRPLRFGRPASTIDRNDDGGTRTTRSPARALSQRSRQRCKTSALSRGARAMAPGARPRDPDRLDAQLDPAHLYSQVPALSVGDRGVIDLLGITRRGRLVVIELKASEDIQLVSRRSTTGCASGGIS